MPLPKCPSQCPFDGAMHTAAMEFVTELEAKLSTPIQREGIPIQSSIARVSSSLNHQHHKTNTHFAGRDQ